VDDMTASLLRRLEASETDPKELVLRVA